MKSNIISMLKQDGYSGNTDLTNSFSNAIHIFEGYKYFQLQINQVPVNYRNSARLGGKSENRTFSQANLDFKHAIQDSYNKLISTCKKHPSTAGQSALMNFQVTYDAEVKMLRNF